jgi:hypothetical protein
VRCSHLYAKVRHQHFGRAASKSCRYGVRELAPAFWAGSLLPAESAPASRRAESGSKLPHSKFARIAIIPLSYSCGTLTYPWWSTGLAISRLTATPYKDVCATRECDGGYPYTYSARRV